MDEKRIQVTLPEDVLQELDKLGESDPRKKEEIIKEAVCKFLRERNILNCEEMMKNGYIEMADINICIAEDGILEDCHCFEKYEEMLECEKFVD